jgi:hypothetical protein
LKASRIGAANWRRSSVLRLGGRFPDRLFDFVELFDEADPDEGPILVGELRIVETASRMSPAPHLGGSLSRVAEEAVVEIGGIRPDIATVVAKEVARAISFPTLGISEDHVVVVIPFNSASREPRPCMLDRHEIFSNMGTICT